MSEFGVRDVWEAVQRARCDTGVDAVRVSPRTMDDLRRSFSRDAPPPSNVLPAVVFGTRLIIDSIVPDGVIAPVERVTTAPWVDLRCEVQPTDPASDA